MAIVFWEGQFIPEEKACVPISDRGFLFGDGVFTTIKVSSGRVECYDLHLQRLKDSCRQINLSFPNFDFKWIRELLVRNHALEGTWRLKITVSRAQSPSPDLRDQVPVHLLMAMKPYQPPAKDACRATLYPEPICRPSARIKSLAYLDRLYVMDYARLKGFDDAIARSPEGFLLEAAYSNLFWHHEGVFYTPDPSLPLLSGISLSVMRQVAKDMGMQVQEVCLDIDAVPASSNLFICNSLTGSRPVVSLDSREFPRDSGLESLFTKTYTKFIDLYSIDCH